MLNIGLNMDITVNKTQYPLIFNSNTCCNCGANGALVFVDAFGREAHSEIHAFDHIKCKKCGSRYSIKWEPSKETNKMVPRAVDHTVKQEFFNLLDKKQIKEYGIKEFEK